MRLNIFCSGTTSDQVILVALKLFHVEVG